MSACGTKRTCQSLSAMSAFGGKADIGRHFGNVCFCPKADIPASLDTCRPPTINCFPVASWNGATDMAEERVQRRLAAILAADVAGYSRLMGSDDEGTFASLKACRELIALKSKQHRGRTVNTPGDSVLVEFASAVDAAR